MYAYMRRHHLCLLLLSSLLVFIVISMLIVCIVLLLFTIIIIIRIKIIRISIRINMSIIIDILARTHGLPGQACVGRPAVRPARG